MSQIAFRHEFKNLEKETKWKKAKKKKEPNTE